MKLQAIVTYSETRLVDFEADSHAVAMGTLNAIISSTTEKLGTIVDVDAQIEVIGENITVASTSH